MRRPSLIEMSAAIALIELALAVTGVSVGWLRVLVGIPLVFLLPGYALTAALLPDGALGRLERFALSIGSSLALAVVLGLLLAQTAEGLGAAPWAIVLAGFTLLADAVAFWRARLRLVSADQRPPLVMPSAALLVLAATAAGVLLTVITASARIAIAPASGEIVQLWALADRVGGRDRVRIGMSNLQSSTRLYHLRAFEGDTVLAEETFDLPVGTSAALVVHPEPSASRMTPVTVVLTPVGNGDQRTVSVWPASTAATGTEW